ncbi:cupin domain-containing protein [Enterococcus sp. 22-H-5-01]|uniref:cupin domain-containing protein n=1 Tax=Enterococcus sp. 22-H-5-01 TaxID=3418555 RepID=UPI003D080369
MEIINLSDKFSQFNDTWSPKILGDIGDYQVKVAKFENEFTWHHHENEDEFFLVIEGLITIHVKENGKEVEYPLHSGEAMIVPKGVEHMPVSEGISQVLLLEPATTLNTGNVVNEKTVKDLDNI